MKLQALLSASLLAGLAAFSAAALAEEKAAPAADMKAEKMAPAVKPHSHMQEKTGIQQDAAPAAPAKKNAAKDKSKHYHPRDAK